MRVALDTNVIISALATRGLSADVVRVVLAEHELLLGRSAGIPIFSPRQLRESMKRRR